MYRRAIIPYNVWLGLSFMNAEFVSVGVQAKPCSAAGHVERLNGERRFS
jgi:hypothetical protein